MGDGVCNLGAQLFANGNLIGTLESFTMSIDKEVDMIYPEEKEDNICRDVIVLRGEKSHD